MFLQGRAQVNNLGLWAISRISCAGDALPSRKVICKPLRALRKIRVSVGPWEPRGIFSQGSWFSRGRLKGSSVANSKKVARIVLVSWCECRCDVANVGKYNCYLYMSDCFLFMLHLSKMFSTLKQPLLSHLLLLNGFFVLMENPFVAVAYVYENMCVGEQKYHHPHLHWENIFSYHFTFVSKS